MNLLFTYLLTHLLTFFLTFLLTYFITNSFSYSLNYFLTHLLCTYFLLTYSFNHLLILLNLLWNGIADYSGFYEIADYPWFYYGTELQTVLDFVKERNCRLSWVLLGKGVADCPGF